MDSWKDNESNEQPSGILIRSRVPQTLLTLWGGGGFINPLFGITHMYIYIYILYIITIYIYIYMDVFIYMYLFIVNNCTSFPWLYYVVHLNAAKQTGPSWHFGKTCSPQPGRCSTPDMAHQLILMRDKFPAPPLANIMLIGVVTSTCPNKG